MRIFREIVEDLTTGNLAGCSFGQIPLYKSVGVGVAYGLVAIGALFFSV